LQNPYLKKWQQKDCSVMARRVFFRSILIN